MIPGEILLGEGDILCNEGSTPITISVENTSDHTVMITSHYHFFEVNKRLRFDRRAAYGKRLDIPAGASVHWDSGEVKDVNLIDLAGRRRVYGYQGLVNGPLTEQNMREAMARDRGFLDTGA